MANRTTGDYLYGQEEWYGEGRGQLGDRGVTIRVRYVVDPRGPLELDGVRLRIDRTEYCTQGWTYAGGWYEGPWRVEDPRAPIVRRRTTR